MTKRASVVAACVMAAAAPAAARPPVRGTPMTTLHIGGAEIAVELAAGKLDASRAELIAWVSTAANAVTAYFGRFPVTSYRLVIVPVAGAAGVQTGTTWPYGGAHSQVIVGEHTSALQFTHDWVMTHEMIHTAFPDQPDDHNWIEEGTATYIEPFARSWVGNYPADKIWPDLSEQLPNGLPRAGDRGLDHTHTWGRTYWGGALFCMLADLEIRERTHGQRGLVDAMRGILAAGGNDQVDWSIERTFAVADKAIGVPVLEELYAKLKDAPVTPDLPALWKQLGVARNADGAPALDDQAPKAAIRRAISAAPAATVPVPAARPAVPAATGAGSGG